jgi:hypothetical protein
MVNRPQASQPLLFKLEPVDPGDWDYPEVVTLDMTAAAPLNENERKSVDALIAYVAYGTKTTTADLSREVAERFGIANINLLQSQHYEEVVRFLVDLVTFELLDEPDSQTIN